MDKRLCLFIALFELISTQMSRGLPGIEDLYAKFQSKQHDVFESPALKTRMVAGFPQKLLTFSEKYGNEGVSKSA